jgi:transposase
MNELSALLDQLTPGQREVVQQAQQKAQEQSQKAAAEIKRLEMQVEHQRLVILQLRRERYGKKGEKLSSLQLELLENEPAVSAGEVAAEAGMPDPLLPAEEEEAGAEPAPKKRYSVPHGGRRPFPAHLPRVERILECTPEECRCGQCGAQKKFIDWDINETLDLKPLEFFVLQTKRAKYACPACPEEGVQQPPVPPRVIDRGLCEDRVVIEVLLRKFGDHQPLYRQSAGFLRDTGVSLSRKTLDGWVMRVGELLIAVNEALFAEVIASTYTQCDESPVPVLDVEKPGGTATGWWWTYSTPGGAVSYQFANTRGHSAALKRLEAYQGRLQTDGYVVYDKFDHPGLVHLGCWSHARRPFWQLVILLRKDAAQSSQCRHAIGILEVIGKLYKEEKVLRLANAPPDERLAHRQAHSVPLLPTIKERILAAQAQALPQSKLGKACAYALGQWPKLVRLFDYGDTELDTNWAENSIRPLVLGRKNWLHIGSWEAGPRIAAIASVLESAKRLKVDLRAYLADILPRLATTKVSEVPTLTPAAWLAARGSR